jgi:hypothetical protein
MKTDPPYSTPEPFTMVAVQDSLQAKAFLVRDAKVMEEQARLQYAAAKKDREELEAAYDRDCKQMKGG